MIRPAGGCARSDDCRFATRADLKKCVPAMPLPLPESPVADTGYRPRWTAQLLHYPRWLDVRIQDNPAYKISILGMVEYKRLLLVEKVGNRGP